MTACHECGREAGKFQRCTACHRRLTMPKSDDGWRFCNVCGGINNRHAPSCKR